MKNGARYRPYPRYKDSGVEWLAEIPNDWQTRKLKFAAKPDSRGAFGIKGDLGLDERDDLFPAFSAAGQDIWVERADYEGPGIVLSAIGARCGKCFKANGKWSALANTQVFLPHEGFDRDYVWYLINREAFWLKGGSAQPYVQIPASINQRIPFPSLPEQRAIAEFLDRETAKIDELIARKERLLELLEGKRAALITYAVTRGLNPDAPLRDSGIEWLGQIPAHWEVRRAKTLFRLFGGYAFSGENFVKDDDRYPALVTPGNFSAHGGLQFEQGKTIFFTGEYPTEFELRVGDQLIVLTDLSYKKLILGRCVTVDRDRLLLNQRIAKLVFEEATSNVVERTYLSYVLNSLLWREQLICTAVGTTVFHSSPSKVGDCKLPLPPLSEQRNISAYIECEAVKLKRISNRVLAAIEHLKEYRAALITASVTGKIDVRDQVEAAA